MVCHHGRSGPLSLSALGWENRKIQRLDSNRSGEMQVNLLVTDLRIPRCS